MLVGGLLLFGVTLVGVFVACLVFGYNISPLRKAGAAACFAVLNLIPIPIPLLPVILPAVGLYICLMDDNYDRGAVNKVFGLTFLFAVLGVLLVYRL